AGDGPRRGPGPARRRPGDDRPDPDADPGDGAAGAALAPDHPPELRLGAGLQRAGRAAGGLGRGDAADRRDRHGRLVAGGDPQRPAPVPGARMRILLLQVPISMVLLAVAIWAFVWAVRRGQFDDLDTPALDILADDDRPAPPADAPAAPMPGDARDAGAGEPGAGGPAHRPQGQPRDLPASQPAGQRGTRPDGQPR